MANPTLITTGFEKHVRSNAVYRANTFTELSERIIGSSARLRGLTFVSETAGVDVTLSPGDFISVNQPLDVTDVSRTSGVIVRLTSNTVIDISGFTDPYIYGYVDDAIEDTGSPIQFLVTEASPPPNNRYAPIIFQLGGTWQSYQAIGNDELASAGILASGSDTKPSGIGGTVTITHNLGLASYKIFLQPINLTAPTYGAYGILTFPEVGELYIRNQLVNSFDVRSDSSQAVDFVWMVIA